MQVNNMMEGLLTDAMSGGSSNAMAYAKAMTPSIDEYLMPQSAFNMSQF
jgi:hypothetical protein